MTRRLLSLTLAVGLLWAAGGCRKPAGSDVRDCEEGKPCAGYTLIEQIGSRTSELIDMEGRVVHRWTSRHKLGGAAELLPDGSLLRCGFAADAPLAMPIPGECRVIERLDWEGNLRWSFALADPGRTLHHEVTVLPGGNLLLLGLEALDREQLLAAGRDPERMRTDEAWLDFLIEVQPAGEAGGRIVWEWHLRDHLIQDHDPQREGYGIVADHPELVDINFIENLTPITGSTLSRLQSLGYVGGGGAPLSPEANLPDWTHANAISYNARLDQILLTVRTLGEVWVIDHGTSTTEAAGHAGGKAGHGGDLLYRWGNPQAYQRGEPGDQQLFGPHHGQWIPGRRPGTSAILIFNNGEGRRDGAFSAIEEIQPPLPADGRYAIAAGKPYGPAQPVWRHLSAPKTSFFSSFLSGVQRLANDNTLICSGMQGEVFEVDRAGRTVWSFKTNAQVVQPSASPPPNPGMGEGPPGSFPRPFGGPPSGPPGGPPGGFPEGSLPGPGHYAPPEIPGTGGLFRAVRYGLDHPAFKGRQLTPEARSE